VKTDPSIIDKAFTLNLDKRMLRDELAIISDWCDKWYKGGNTLEIGAYKGMTSYVMASKLQEREKEENKHFIVDLFEVIGDIEWLYEEHPQQLLIDNLGDFAKYCDVIKSPSLGYVALDKIFNTHFDYVFIDGDHTFPVVFMELLMCELTCDKIFGHDYGHRGVTKSVDMFCKERGYTFVQPGNGYGLFELIKK